MTRLPKSLGLGIWLLCAAFGLSLSFPAPARAQPVKSDLSNTQSTVDIEGFTFPRRIAGLARKGKTDFGSTGLGFGVSYFDDSTTWADIYIYDRQLDLPANPSLPLAKRELDSAIDDVRAFIKSGRYQGIVVQNISNTDTFAKAHLKLTQDGKEMDSFVFVSVRNGKFVKIRLSSTAGPDASKIADRFLKDYDRASIRKPKK